MNGDPVSGTRRASHAEMQVTKIRSASCLGRRQDALFRDSGFMNKRLKCFGFSGLGAPERMPF